MSASVEFSWHGDYVKLRSHEGGRAGLTLGTEHLLEASNRGVPLEEGTLERSGVAMVDDASMKGAVSYDTVYAVRQHEELTWRHAPGRRAKYLELAFTEEAETLHKLIATAIRRALA